MKAYSKVGNFFPSYKQNCTKNSSLTWLKSILTNKSLKYEKKVKNERLKSRFEVSTYTNRKCKKTSYVSDVRLNWTTARGCTSNCRLNMALQSNRRLF